MKFTGHLSLKAKGLQKSVAADWLRAVNARVQSRIPRLTQRVRERLRQTLTDAPEFTAICGRYRGEFGLNDAEERIAVIVNALSETVSVIFKPFRYASGSNVAGGVTLIGCPIDNKRLYELAEAYVIDKGEAFPWLWALLEQGDSIVVADYRYLASPPLKPEAVDTYSRTKSGFMVPAKGSGFRIPPDISGTQTDNVITRAIQSSDFQAFIQGELYQLIA